MTSKESLKNICLECEREKGKNQVACPFRSISNEYCEEYDTIEKDLDRFEALKRDLKEYQAYIKKGVEEHYKDFMSDYDLLLQEYQELYKKLEILEILKKHIYSSDSSISIILDDLRNYDDFKKIKEWLENE